MSINSEQELQGMKRAGAVAAEALRAMKEMVSPNVTPADLNLRCAEVFKKHSAVSAPALFTARLFTPLFLLMPMSFTVYPRSANFKRVMS